MLLAVDVGNTSTVMGLYEGPELLAHWRVATDRMRMADQYAVLLKNLLELDGVPPPRRAIVSSVVPPAEREIGAALARYWGVTATVVRSDLVADLLVIETDNPREVGADRIVNAVAALEYDAAALVVVDFGTATNFDLVLKPNRLLGVALAPGPMIAADALFARAAKLPRVDLVAPAAAVGKNTVTALQSGLVFGYASMVDGMVRRFKREIDPALGAPLVIATGGFATTLEGLCEEVMVTEPLLTLAGLRLIAGAR
ncbi:MAG: type III pantothenate kinase [Deinococcota bacterium]|jgi:type III pantothenate kinase|nr:type III pantothenate kinase [Deinococcota bacterium]